MKLYEAIRLGSMLHPQTFGRLATRIEFKSPNSLVESIFTVVGTCALGAAKEAFGTNGAADTLHMKRFRQLYVSCPGKVQGYNNQIIPCNWHPLEVETIIALLNDSHHWNREAIANWLEPIEEEFCSKQEQEEEKVLVECLSQ